MKSKIYGAFGFFIAGACMALGIQAVDWSIGKPPLRVVVCKASDLDHIEACKPIREASK